MGNGGSVKVDHHDEVSSKEKAEDLGTDIDAEFKRKSEQRNKNETGTRLSEDQSVQTSGGSSNSDVIIPVQIQQLKSANSAQVASPYETTEGTKDYCCIARLLLDICNDAVRDVLRDKLHKQELLLTKTLLNKRHKFSRLLEPEQKLLFPENNKLVTYQSLDFSLLYKIARNICPKKIEPNGSLQHKWGKSPSKSDSSLLAALERIRHSRNEFFAHAPAATIKKTNVEAIWNDIEFSLDSIEKCVSTSVSYTKEMKILKEKQIDPETEKRLKELVLKEKQVSEILEMEAVCDERLSTISTELVKLLTWKKTHLDKILGQNRGPTTKRDEYKMDNNAQTIRYLSRFMTTHKYFVETTRDKKIKQLLETKKCVTIVGEEGSGKTALAVHLLFEYMNKDWIVRKINDPSDFASITDRNELVFVDEMFNCDKTVLKTWWKKLDWLEHIIGLNDYAEVSTDDANQTLLCLVITSRRSLLDEAFKLMRKKHSLLTDTKIDISSDLQLMECEKQLVLESQFRYAKEFLKIDPPSLNDKDVQSILRSKTPLGFPLCAQIFACHPIYHQRGHKFFENPFDFLKNRLVKEIEDDTSNLKHDLFVVLLICKISKTEVRLNETEKCLKLFQQCKIPKESELDELADVALECKETYLSQINQHTYTFKNSSVSEAVESYFIEKYVDQAIDVLPLDNLIEKVGVDASCLLPGMVSVAGDRFHLLSKRMLDEIEKGKEQQIFSSSVMACKPFVEYFVKSIQLFENFLCKERSAGLPIIYWSMKHGLVLFSIALLNRIKEDVNKSGEKIFNETDELLQKSLALFGACSKRECDRNVFKFIEDLLEEDPSVSMFCVGCKFNCETHETSLHRAVSESNEEVVLALLKKRARFSHSCWEGWPVLHSAVCVNETSLCDLNVLRSVYDFENRKRMKEEENVETDIFSASRSHSSQIVQTLHKHCKSVLDVLIGLTRDTFLEVTDSLIDAYLSLDKVKKYEEETHSSALNYIDERGDTLMHVIINCRVENDIHIDLEYDSETPTEEKTSLNLISSQESYEAPTYARSENVTTRLQTVQRLIRKGASTNIRNTGMNSPLMLEISKYKPDIMIAECLLKGKTDPNNVDRSGRTVLHVLVSQQYDESINLIDFIELLMMYNISPNCVDSNGNTPLMIELKKDRPNPQIVETIVRRITEKGLDLSFTDKSGATPFDICLKSNYQDESSVGQLVPHLFNHANCLYPLHYVVEHNIKEQLKLQALSALLDTEKVKITDTDNTKRTLLITAVINCPEMTNLLKFLLDKGIDINAADEAGNTALHYAAVSNLSFSIREKAFHLLIDHRPDVEKQNKKGHAVFSHVMQVVARTSPLSKDINEIVPDMKDDIIIDGLTTIMEILSEHSPQSVLEVDGKKRSYMHYCVSSRLSDNMMLSVCQILCKFGLNVDLCDENNASCILLAFKFSARKFATLSFLLENSGAFDDNQTVEVLRDLADRELLYPKLISVLKQRDLLKNKEKEHIFHYIATIQYTPSDRIEREGVFDELKEAYPLNQKNEDGNTPLLVALKEGVPVNCVLNFVRICEKDDVECKDKNGDSCLHVLIGSNKSDFDVLAILKKMYKLNPNLNIVNKKKQTLIMAAVKCREERMRVIEFLITNGINLNLKDNNGFTVFHHCVDSERCDFEASAILKCLMESNIQFDINAYSNDQNNVLNLASKHSDHSRVLCILQLLSNEDCDVSTVDRVGRSPMYNSVLFLRGHNVVVLMERLLRVCILGLHGVRACTETNKKRTVFHICSEKGYDMLQDLLDAEEHDEMVPVIKAAYKKLRASELPRNENKHNPHFSSKVERNLQFLITEILEYLSHRTLPHDEAFSDNQQDVAASSDSIDYGTTSQQKVPI